MDNENLIWIPYQNGKLAFHLNEEYEAVLCDYQGDAKVLYLPSSISITDENEIAEEYPTSNVIPDCSFTNCKTVEVLVCGFNTHFEFGYFVFSNCPKLETIVLLSISDKLDTTAVINEFSFTKANYIPMTIKAIKLILGEEWEYYHSHDIYLPDSPSDPLYEHFDWEYVDFLECRFAFMDWLRDNLHPLITRTNINPDLFLSLAEECGIYDNNKCRDCSGNISLFFHDCFNYNTPTLTRCIPVYDESAWRQMTREQRNKEWHRWAAAVSSYFE